MHPLIPFQCSFASVVLVLLFSLSSSTSSLVAYDDCKSPTEEVTLPDPPFDNNNSSLSRSDITIESEISAAKSTYLMKLCVKTSGGKQATYANLDTGSDLIWLNAKDCIGEACHCTDTGHLRGECIKKEAKDLIKCGDKKCEEKLKKLKIEPKCDEGFCQYDVKYGDGFRTEGLLGSGQFHFLPKIPTLEKKTVFFGFSKNSVGNLAPESRGIVGLGFGDLSLIKQYDKIDPKFSYCLPRPEPGNKGKFRFGSAVQTFDKISTPLWSKPGDVCEFRYCVHLSSISFNGDKDKEITVNKDKKVMVVDSGTTFTYLVNGLFNEFLEKVKHAIGPDYKHIEIKPDDNCPFDQNQRKEDKCPYDNCFECSSNKNDNCFEEKCAKKLEKLSFGFGVDNSKTEVELKWQNFFDEYPKGETNYICLTVVDGDKKQNIGNGRNNNHHILGSRAQMNFLVTFDLGKEKKVSFEDKQDCSELNGEFSAL